MRRNNRIEKIRNKRRTGFSLVELVITIVIIAVLAVAVFAGGSAAIKKAQVSRATSDLHNFDIAMQTYMFSNRTPVNLSILSPKEDFNKVVDGVNQLLPKDYILEATTLPITGNIFSALSFLNVYESGKTDPWDNPYYFLIDPTARNAGETEYYFSVLSAGPNGKANVGGLLDKDDIFLLCQYSNGTVSTQVYNMKSDFMDLTGSPLTVEETSLVSYSGSSGSSPRNNGPAAKDTEHTHNWKVDVDTQPNCTQAGMKKTRCVICGKVETENRPARGHTWSAWTVATAPTCTNTGVGSRHCTVCGLTQTGATIPAKGHTWENKSVKTEPTIDSEGIQEQECSVCHATREIPIPSLPTLAAAAAWYNPASEFNKEEITKITFKTSYTPTGLEEESWTAGKDVTAYRTGTEIILAGDGRDKIYATNLKGTFKNFYALQSIEGLQLLDIRNVENMSYMFYDCRNLTTLNVSNFYTKKVKDMSFMFQGCGSLTALDVSGFDTGNVKNMNSMFRGCQGLTSLDVSGFNTSNVTNIGTMFYGCSSLTSLDVSKFNTSNVTSMSAMFNSCISLTSLDVTRFDTRNVENMSYMFYECRNLTTLNVSNFHTEKVKDMSFMFQGCGSLTALDVSGFDTGNVENMNSMFRGCKGLTSLDVSGFNTSNVTNIGTMFYGCSSLTSLDVSKFNTSNVTSMSAMFNSCISLTSLDVTRFDTRNVENMSYMFYECRNLTTLNVSNFHTEKVKNMSFMFQGCGSLTALDVSGFDTGNVKNMSSMFRGCQGLTSLDVSGFNTSNVTTMGTMFYGCSSLTSLDVSKFNTSNVTSMGKMFNGCSGLTSLDLSNWNTGKVLPDKWGSLFTGMSSKVSITVGPNFAAGDNMPEAGYFIKTDAETGETTQVITGMFYSYVKKTITIYGEASSHLRNYNFSKDNIIVTFAE